MPTSKIKKDAREGKGSVKSLEKKWDRAKDAAKGEGKGGDDWPLTMHIYQNMTKSSVSARAAYRLRATADVDGASPDSEEYAADVMDMEGMNGDYTRNHSLSK